MSGKNNAHTGAFSQKSLQSHYEQMLANQ